MAKVRIRIDDFEDGLLPGICAASGAPGARLYHADIPSKAPAWVWLLVFAGPAGIVLALLVAQFARKVAHGYVPYADEVQAVLRERSRRYALAVVSCVALFTTVLVLLATGGLGVGSASGFRTLGLVLCGAALLGGLVFFFLWCNLPGSVGGNLDSTGRWIELDPVSAGFAAAYEAQEADRRAARRAEVIGTRQDR